MAHSTDTDNSDSKNSSPPKGGSRAKRVFATSAGFFIVRLTAVVTSIVTLPLALHNLGNERYGLWVALTGVVQMLAFADLGLGSGLTNVIAATPEDDHVTIRRAVSNTFITIGIMNVAWFLVALAVLPVIPWARLFHLASPTAASEALPTIWALLICMLFNIPAGLVNRIQLGRQEGVRNAIWATGNSIGTLIGVVVTLRAHCSLPIVIVGFAGPVTVGNAINLFWELGFRSPKIRPRFSDFDGNLALSFIKVGLSFLLVQTCSSLTQWTDYVIVASTLGAEANVPYSSAFRIFSVALIAVYMTRALWPAFNQALSRGEFGWAKRVFLKTLAFNAIYGTIMGILLVRFSPFIAMHWLGKGQVALPGDMVFAFGWWLLVMNVVEGISALSMSTAFLKFHTRYFTIAAIATFLLRIFLVRTMGLSGIVWGVIICHVCLYIVPMLRIMQRTFSSSDGTTSLPSLATGT